MTSISGLLLSFDFKVFELLVGAMLTLSKFLPLFLSIALIIKVIADSKDRQMEGNFDQMRMPKPMSSRLLFYSTGECWHLLLHVSHPQHQIIRFPCSSTFFNIILQFFPRQSKALM